MSVIPKPWSDLVTDNPVALLTRTKLETEHMLVAKVHLDKGCVVNLHSHPSEQVSIMLSGRGLWKLGPEGEQREIEQVGGQVLHLPSGFPHGIVALEDCELIDILSPPGAMGVDAQKP